MEDLFQIFVREWSLRSIQQAFYQLCVNRGVDPSDYTNIYEKLKDADRFLETSSKQRQLWALLDKRRAQKEYQGQQICTGMNVLIVGGGPCGLRAAIECAMLGAHVVVAESRDKFTRNNVLHLWQFVIHDLKALGAKVFMPKFCTGSIEHISIRKLQFILLKIALVLGVQFYDSVYFEDLVEPRDDKGWRAQFSPRDHILSDYEFDVVMGASGKNMCLPAFQQVVVRGKLAIGITANFVNHHTKQEDSVPEIQGVAYIYRQQFFDQLQQQTGVKLENIVYYKGDTHYFVMCGDKQNLVQKGVIKNDNENIKDLLAKENIDNELLCKYVMQVVDFATEGGLAGIEFAKNARRESDVALFDFTELCSADHSTRFVKYLGHPLVMTVVGDLLHEPFWPTGSGCARGFLGVLDSAWLLHGVGSGKRPISQLLAEREGVYRLLGQTQPNNLSSSYHKYSIDPQKRYVCFNQTLSDVEYLMGTGDSDENKLDSLVMKISRNSANQAEFHRKASIFRFCFMSTLTQKHKIHNFKPICWADGRALASLISKYKQDFECKLFSSSTDSPMSPPPSGSTLCMDALNFAEERLGVPKPCKTHMEWANLSEKKRVDYLEGLVDLLRADPFYNKLCMSPTLCQSYASDKAKQSARQAKILRARQLPPMDPRDSVLNCTPLPPPRTSINESHITVRKSRQSGALPSLAPTPPKTRRSIVEPLNPELLYKVDRIVSGSSLPSPAKFKPPRPSMQGGPSCKERQKMFTEAKVETKESRLDQSLNGGSLAGVQSVSKFRAQFDSIKEVPPTPERGRLAKVSESVERPASKSPVDSISSATSTSSSDKEDLSDSMNVRVSVTERLRDSSISPPTDKIVSFRNNQNFVYSRPYSMPVQSTSPPKLTTSPNSAAHQHSLNAVYNNVSQRRMRLCSVCQGEVYLAEQLLVDRVSVHKQCFRCAYCDRALTVKNACLDKTFQREYGPRWYCAQHQMLASSDKLLKLRRNLSKLESVAVVPPNTSSSSSTQPQYAVMELVSSDSTDSSLPELSNSSKVVVEKLSTSTHSTQTRPEVQQSTQTTPKAENRYSGLRIRDPSPIVNPRNRHRMTSSLNKAMDTSRVQETKSNVVLDDRFKSSLTQSNKVNMMTQPELSHKKVSELNSNRYERRLSDLDSPTQLINACKERTAKRMASITMKNDENLGGERKTGLSGSSSEEEWNVSAGFCTRSTYPKVSDDDLEEEEFEEDINDSEEKSQSFSDEEESWMEFWNYLDTNLAGDAIDQGAVTDVLVKNMVEGFNKMSIKKHFKPIKFETPVNSAMMTVSETPFFTPRQNRAGTVNTTLERDDATLFHTPQTSRRPTFNDEDTARVEEFVTPKQSATPQRPSRYKRGPRRATVAIDLKREALTPEQLRNLKMPEGNAVTTAASEVRSGAVHIKPTVENLHKIRKEIEMIKGRRQREKQREIQVIQRRLEEIEVRMIDVKSVGQYLEKGLQKNPEDKWELEQWLIYAQQLSALRSEEQELKLTLRIISLEEDYHQLKGKLHSIQEMNQDFRNRRHESSERELINRLQEVLDKKDTAKRDLLELQEMNKKPRNTPAQLIDRASSYMRYEPVFLSPTSSPTRPIQSRYTHSKIHV